MHTHIGILIFRAELAIICGIMLLFSLFKRHITISELILNGIEATVCFIGLSVLLDSMFWNYLVWPEGQVFWFNTVLNKSSDWGTFWNHSDRWVIILTSLCILYRCLSIPMVLLLCFTKSHAFYHFPCPTLLHLRCQESSLAVASACIGICAHLLFLASQRAKIHHLRLSYFKCSCCQGLDGLVNCS